MLILASNSPRRKELITEYITSDFLIIPSNSKEEYKNEETIEENILRIAKAKGKEVFLSHPDDTIISADTMVVFNNKVYGKPKDLDDAKKMLNELSNNEHQVFTAYYIFKGEKVKSRLVKSTVKFKLLSEEFIDNYINNNSPLDKAGSYGIQDEAFKEAIEYYIGSLTNIIGLPVEQLKKDLASLK